MQKFVESVRSYRSLLFVHVDVEDSPFLDILGVGIELAVVVHRWCGWAVIFLFCLHGAIYWFAWIIIQG